MYWLNSTKNGDKFQFQAYDDAIEALELHLGEQNFKVRRDSEMKNVWWITVIGNIVYMLTSAQPVSNIERES